MRTPALTLLLASAMLIATACTGDEEPSTATPAPTPTPTATTAEAAPLRDPPVIFSPLPPGYRLESVVTSLDQPTSMAFTPDGRLLVAEQERGTIRVVEGGVLLPEPFYQVEVYRPPIEKLSELGLVGIAVDPDFAANGFVYMYYTEPPGPSNLTRSVLLRVRDEGGVGVEPTEIISDIAAQEECCHVAGNMRFAADGTMFVSVGDHQMEEEAQKITSPFGKILRINKDGSVPPDNPFVDVPGADARIFAYGLRNPYDIAIHPITGQLYAGENGAFGFDTIHIIRPGANYGWPPELLSVPPEEVPEPVKRYLESIGPAGIEFYVGDKLPEFVNDLFFCQYHRGGALHRMRLVEDTFDAVVIEGVVATGCTNDVLTGPDGFLYFLNYFSGTVYRIASGE